MSVEVSLVRNQLRAATERARSRAQNRRQRAADAEDAFRRFLDEVAVPLARQLAQTLKSEGRAFTVFTPSGGLRLSSDHGRDDYIELMLDTTGETPQVLGRTSRVRGSRTITDERPLKGGAAPSALTEQDVLDYFLESLEPWLER